MCAFYIDSLICLKIDRYDCDTRFSLQQSMKYQNVSYKYIREESSVEDIEQEKKKKLNSMLVALLHFAAMSTDRKSSNDEYRSLSQNFVNAVRILSIEKNTWTQPLSTRKYFFSLSLTEVCTYFSSKSWNYFAEITSSIFFLIQRLRKFLF